MKLKMMYAFLNTDITLIEKELEQTVHTDETLITDASLHLLQAGGNEFALYLFCWQLNLGITTSTKSNTWQ